LRCDVHAVHCILLDQTWRTLKNTNCHCVYMYADKNLRWRRETARRSVLLCLRPRVEGGSKHCFCSSIRPFVCPSVCPSVSHTASNSRTPRPNVPKFGRKVPYLRCDLHTSFNVKRSQAGSHGPLMLTHIVRHNLPNGKAYELQTWYTDGGRRLASATTP